MTTRPDRSEAAPYYFTYIDKVPDGDIVDTLERQRDEVARVLSGISESQSAQTYAPGKWTIKQVLGHCNDAERLFAFRAFWFARNLDSALPSFDQDVAISHTNDNERTWRSQLDEFAAVRSSTLALLSSLPADAWSRSGTASDYRFSVRALVWICAGHVEHHLRLLKERYGVA